VSLLLRRQNLVSLISTSSDGAIAAEILDSLGFQIVRGSSSKGGITAVRSMIKELKTGKCGAITPDGPRGPRYHLQKGVVLIGQKADTPLVPFHVEATKQWVFKSWDKHKFPKPFSTIYISFGEPFSIPNDLDKNQFEKKRQCFENSMLKNVQKSLNLANEADDRNGI